MPITMSRLFQVASAAAAALTASAYRPPAATPLGAAAFAGGWLTAELAPHNLALVAAGSTVHLARHGLGSRGDRLALVADAAAAVGLVGLIQQGRHSGDLVERALRESLGDGYADCLDPALAPSDLATPWRQVLTPWKMSLPDVEVTRDVQYTGHGRRHRLDIYRHRSPGGDRPVLLQIHGGGWAIGAKHQQGLPLMYHMAAKGWVCVAPNYRLSPKATWPDHLVDIKRALIWARENIAEYGGDPSFIAVTGGSAGGHLAAMLALTANVEEYQQDRPDVDTTLQACVPHYGVYDLAGVTGTYATRARRDAFLGPLVFKQRARDGLEPFAAASPILLVRPDAPPFFVIHGANDTLVPSAEARTFVDRLRDISTQPVVYAELPVTQHAFDVFPSIRSAHVVRGVERFLRYVHANRFSAEMSVPGAGSAPSA